MNLWCLIEISILDSFEKISTSPLFEDNNQMIFNQKRLDKLFFKEESTLLYLFVSRGNKGSIMLVQKLSSFLNADFEMRTVG